MKMFRISPATKAQTANSTLSSLRLMLNSSTRSALKYVNFRHFATFDPSPFSPLQLLQFSVNHRSLNLTKQSHARVIHHGLHQHTVTITKLISAYSLLNHLHQSQLLFDSVCLRDTYLWNVLINEYAKNNLISECYHTFTLMCTSSFPPDEFTFSTLAKVSGGSGDLVGGESVHAKCIKSGFVDDSVVLNSLISMYAKCDRFIECRKLFDEMLVRTVATWNVIIGGYVRSQCNGFDEEILGFVKSMQEEGLMPNKFTVSTLLPLCRRKLGMCDYGKEIHCYVVKNGLDMDVGSDVHLGCCLIDMYSKSERVHVSRRVFDQLMCKNVFTWTAMVNGYVKFGDLDEAISLFQQMQGRGGVEPNVVSLVSVLPACGSLARLRSGKEIHGFAIRKKLNDEALFNSLIDVYSKCGSLNYAKRVFEHGCVRKDCISWSSMISGYGFHGEGKEAVALYNKMLQHGTKPDMITIVGVLSACCRSGLVEDGLNIYYMAVNKYQIIPTSEICACMVDMFGRSGQFDEALSFIKTMLIEPGPSVWGALVNASVLQGNHEMLDSVYKFLIELEPANPSNYVSLSNLYATSKRWDLVAEMREAMKGRGLKKLPGCSWVSINSETHSFHVADKAHPRLDMIYEMLNAVILAMTDAGYFPACEI